MSFENAHDTLKRRIEALEHVVENLQEKNQSWEEENKRLKGENQGYEEEIQKLKEDNQCYDIMNSIEKLHESLKKRHFRIEKLIQNPGLQHIALSIFKELDPKSLANCRVVSKEWKACIDQDKYWWHLQLIKCKEILKIMSSSLDANSLENRMPEFMKTMEYIYERESIDSLKSFATFMSSYRKKISEIENKFKWETPLHFAADENRIDIFDMLVNSPHMKSMNVENFNDLDYQGLQRTLLGHACFNEEVDVINFYMNLKGDKKIDFNEIPPAPWGFSLFHSACHSNHIEVVKLFLDRADELKIDLNARIRENNEDFDRGNDGKTPIMYAMKPEVMKLLLADERIDVNATDDKGHTALYYVIDCWDVILECDTPEEAGRFKVQELLDTFTLLLESSRFDPTIDERTGCSVLHIAVVGRSEFAEVILKCALTRSNIDVNCRDIKGQSPTHYAFRHSSLCWKDGEFPDDIRFLMKYAKELGIDLEARDNRGRTPMHHMCESKYNPKKCVERFLQIAKKEFGIEFNLEATDEDEKTPFELFPEEMACFSGPGFSYLNL